MITFTRLFIRGASRPLEVATRRAEGRKLDARPEFSRPANWLPQLTGETDQVLKPFAPAAMAYISRSGMATLSSLRSISSMEQIRKDLVSCSPSSFAPRSSLFDVRTPKPTDGLSRILSGPSGWKVSGASRES